MPDTVTNNAELRQWLDGYGEKTRRFDAMWDAAQGAPRAHWLPVLSSLAELGTDGLANRCDEAERLLQENGVGFDVGAHSEERERRIAFDPVPVLISPNQWAVLEQGLKQRARLMDAVLKDLYGPRNLIRDGAVPAEIIFEYPGFQPVCDGAVAPGLMLYAADIAWDSDGQPRVVADRTQAPAGTGYALETRIVCSRILPNIIRTQPVERLAGFFQALRETVRATAPHQHYDPRTVVLSRGPDDAGYFDHAYLASYLGYPLVQGQDLTVRGGHLWLKTVEGLKLVDVVVRRLADGSCDALELNGWEDSGVPGLLQVARNNRVMLGNPIGAAALENPALVPFLPALARELLGSELSLPSVDSWWCGYGTAHVLANMDRMIVKTLVADQKSSFGPKLNPQERHELELKVKAHPSHYVGQSILDEASTPSWFDNQLVPVRTVTRMFLVRHGDDFKVMPGGFSRSFEQGDFGQGLNSRLRGRCKDTWVLVNESERGRIVWPAATAPQMFVGEREALPSRAAECLYWVGRYAERAEGLARMARVFINVQLDADEYHDDADVTTATILMACMQSRVGDLGVDTAAGLRDVLRNRNRNGSIAWSLHGLSRSAHAVRDRWSNDTWKLLNDMVAELDRLASQRTSTTQANGRLLSTLDAVIGRLASFAGLTLESMTHEDGWRFLMVGRRIERALSLTGLLRQALRRSHQESEDHQIFEATLQIGESIITHRRRYRAWMAAESVLELLLLDAVNPRSLAAAVNELMELVEELPRARELMGRSAEERACLELSTLLRLTDAHAIVAVSDEVSEQGERSTLVALLDKIEALLETASTQIELTYFAHVQQRRLLPGSRD